MPGFRPRSVRCRGPRERRSISWSAEEGAILRSLLTETLPSVKPRPKQQQQHKLRQVCDTLLCALRLMGDVSGWPGGHEQQSTRMALATVLHHSFDRVHTEYGAPRSQATATSAGEGPSETKYAAKFQETPTGRGQPAWPSLRGRRSGNGGTIVEVAFVPILDMQLLVSFLGADTLAPGVGDTLGPLLVGDWEPLVPQARARPQAAGVRGTVANREYFSTPEGFAWNELKIWHQRIWIP